MILKPIGVARSEIKEPVRRDWSKTVPKMVVNDDQSEAVDGLHGFSHIVVHYWMHRANREM
ncbi:hypothetical protein ACFLT8_04725 [Chloroflexota bacterium]